MKKIWNNCLHCFLAWNLTMTVAVAESKVDTKNIVLPSDVREIPKAPGSVFYGADANSGALMPVHIWGEVKKSGLYYVPINSTLIQGISLAGGTIPTSDLEDVRVKRSVNGKLEEMVLDLSDGGDKSSYHYKLESGDTIFVAKDTHMQDRAFYTSLVSVLFTILSSVVLYKEIRDGN